MNTYQVPVIKPSTDQKVTGRVEAADEWKARTRAMLTTEVRQSIRFQGEMAEYEVTQIA
jgi:hypothetical protein